jgi:hypothetical protein
MTAMTASECLNDLNQLLSDMGPDAALTPWAQRAHHHWPTLQAALPARYLQVLQGVLDRLESAALFGGESCSFSQSEMQQLLQQWTAKAIAELANTSR